MNYQFKLTQLTINLNITLSLIIIHCYVLILSVKCLNRAESLDNK